MRSRSFCAASILTMILSNPSSEQFAEARLELTRKLVVLDQPLQSRLVERFLASWIEDRVEQHLEHLDHLRVRALVLRHKLLEELVAPASIFASSAISASPNAATSEPRSA